MAAKAAKDLFKNTIYVGNLPWTVGPQELKNYFSEFGNVIRARVLFDNNTGFSKCSGFVSFGAPVSVQKVYEKVNHVLEGKQLIIQESSKTK